MAIVEYETQVEATPLTEREQRARTLEAAALEIEMRGWSQGANKALNGSVCLVGAVTYALGETPRPAPFGYYEAAVVWGNPALAFDLPMWNDIWATSAEDVTFLLRWRAEEIRDGWDA